MNTNAIEAGYELQVGDLIVGKHAFGVNRYPITRVTAKYAFSYVSDAYEAKFHRDVHKGLHPLPRPPYSMVDYSLKRSEQ